MKTSLWEVYLEECDPSPGVPFPHRMRGDAYANLKKVIEASSRSDVPTVSFYDISSYRNVDVEYDDLIGKFYCGLAFGNIDRATATRFKNYNLKDLRMWGADGRTVGERYSVVLTSGGPRGVETMSPSGCRRVGSAVDSLKAQGVTDAVVVGAHLSECVPEVIKSYLKGNFRVTVPYDATHDLPENFEKGLRKVKSLEARAITTESVLEEMFPAHRTF